MLLLKASKEKEHFYNLIGVNVTFASDIISNAGSLMRIKGEKAFISDVEYTSGYWSRLCRDIYVQPKISTFRIDGINNIAWKPQSFLEFGETRIK